jgi:hypothetical protein
MSHGYNAYDEWLAWARSAQPPPVPALPIIHPGSAAAQLGVTPEEMEELLADQEEWMREEEGGHSVQISDGYVDNMMTLYRLRRPSGRPPDDT